MRNWRNLAYASILGAGINFVYDLYAYIFDPFGIYKMQQTPTPLYGADHIGDGIFLNQLYVISQHIFNIGLAIRNYTIYLLLLLLAIFFALLDVGDQLRKRGD
jgi:hypothetical protein